LGTNTQKKRREKPRVVPMEKKLKRPENTLQSEPEMATAIRRRTEIVPAYNGKTLNHSVVSLPKSEQLPCW